MAEPPRQWMRLDVTFLTRGSIEDLREKHGAAGPLAIIALATTAAEATISGKRKDVDRLTWSYRYLGRRIGVGERKARAIVADADAIGIVNLEPGRGDRFTVQLLRFTEWHGKDPNAAERQRRSRATAAGDMSRE